MKYTNSHEWIIIENGIGIVGISSHAQKELGEVVFIQLPKVGKKVTSGEEIVVLESTKAASDIYSPISGTITEVNEKLSDDPGLVNRSSENEGWLFKITANETSELDSLLDHKQYLQLIS